MFKYLIFSSISSGNRLFDMIIMMFLIWAVPKVYEYGKNKYNGLNYKYEVRSSPFTANNYMLNTVSHYLSFNGVHGLSNFLRYNGRNTDKSPGIDIIPESITKIPDYDISVSITVVERNIERSETTSDDVVTFYYNDRDELDRFLCECRRIYTEHALKYTSSLSVNNYEHGKYVSRYEFRPTTFDRIHFNQKDRLVGILSDFKEGKSKYDSMKILMYGSPGNGKSSVIRAISGMLGYEPYYIKMENIRTMNEFIELINEKSFCDGRSRVDFECDPRKRVLVFEDFDVGYKKITEKRENVVSKYTKIEKIDYDFDGEDDEDEKSKSGTAFNLSDMLNVFDGIFTVPGMIAVFSTNDLEGIDPALLRPGRMSLTLKMDNPDQEYVEKIIRNFFPEFEGFTDKRVFDVSGATVENYCQYFKTVEEVISQFPLVMPEKAGNILKDLVLETCFMSQKQMDQLGIVTEDSHSIGDITVECETEFLSQKQLNQLGMINVEVSDSEDSDEEKNI